MSLSGSPNRQIRDSDLVYVVCPCARLVPARLLPRSFFHVRLSLFVPPHPPSPGFSRPPAPEHQSSLQVALGALSVVRAAVSDGSTALRLVKLGIVSKLAALVRQKPSGPPPPLPPRRRSGSGAGVEQKPPREAAAPAPAPAPAAAGGPLRMEFAGGQCRREEVCAALGVLAGIAEHEACVSLVLEKEDLGFLLQVCMYVLVDCLFACEATNLKES